MESVYQHCRNKIGMNCEVVWGENKKCFVMDHFTDTAAILKSIVSNSYYGILRGQMRTNLPPLESSYDLAIIRK